MPKQKLFLGGSHQDNCLPAQEEDERELNVTKSVKKDKVITLVLPIPALWIRRESLRCRQNLKEEELMVEFNHPSLVLFPLPSHFQCHGCTFFRWATCFTLKHIFFYSDFVIAHDPMQVYLNAWSLMEFLPSSSLSLLVEAYFDLSHQWPLFFFFFSPSFSFLFPGSSSLPPHRQTRFQK